MSKPAKVDTQSLAAIVLLTMFFPGAGHIAAERKVTGAIFAGVTLLLLVRFFMQLKSVVPPLYSAFMAGDLGGIDDALVEQLTGVMVTLIATLLIWFFATVDAIRVGKQLEAKRKKR